MCCFKVGMDFFAKSVEACRHYSTKPLKCLCLLLSKVIKFEKGADMDLFKHTNDPTPRLVMKGRASVVPTRESIHSLATEVTEVVSATHMSIRMVCNCKLNKNKRL